MPSFAELLRRHRHAARMTLEQLAEASGVSARTLSDMERGRSKGPQHRTVTALADALTLPETDRKQLIEQAREGRLRDHWSRPTGLCELPRSVEDFTGRAAELAWTDDIVRADGTPGAAGVALVTGSAGLGKTTLAVRAAHALRPRFPDGVFFVDLFGMSPQPLAADDALAQLVRALGAAEQHLPHGTLARASLYRSLMRERRVLVVLDNARSEEQLRPLLPGGGPSRVLATSRRLLAGLEGVHRLSLGPLPCPEAAELLTGILGGPSDGGTAISELAQLCGGLPLALRIVGNRLASRPGWQPAELVARLTDEERRLDQLKAGDLKIASAFAMSYDQLADLARQVFRRLALVPGRDFDAALAAAVAGTSIEDAWDALDELVDLGLLHDSTSGRYRFHDLVRLFARERLHTEDSPAEREAITEQMASWLVRKATVAGRWFDPAYGPPDRPDPGLSSAEKADRWLRVDSANWLGALRHAADTGRHSMVLECAWSMRWYAGRWMHWPSWKEVFARGAQAATALGDPAHQGAQLTYLSCFHQLPPLAPEAMLGHAAEMLERATGSGATSQIAWGHLFVGRALLQLGQLDEAVVSVSRAAEMFKADSDIVAYCQALGMAGECLRRAGRHAEALDRYLEMCDLAWAEEKPSVAALTRPNALAGAGLCLTLLGRRTEAIATFTQAVDLFDQLSPSGSQARCLMRLADVLDQEGRTGESRQIYARAAEVFEAIGDAEASSSCRDLATAIP
ncbi:tetratricopeptide repeat protein [Nonomuraea sp. NPDC049152]|uniref:ATP-binding protein n=1 Tax=Nonomuraea sp. NPDC049152 TaxID=3154350 RepID=UPI0033EF9BA5